METASVERIYRAGLKFLVPLTLEETYSTILRQALHLVNAGSGTIYLREEDGKFKLVCTTAKELLILKPEKGGNVYKTFMSREPIVANVADFGPDHHEPENSHRKSALFLPLSNQHKTVGVLTLNFQKEEKFNKDELEILKLFGSMVSLAIRKSQLYDEVNRALKARDLFISMAAHELRTPLTTIVGYSQLLYSKLSAANTAESRWVADLLWETSRLTHLVNEFLEVNRIQSGQFHYTFEECHLREVIRRAMADFRFTRPEHKVIVEDGLKGSDSVIGDFEKLLQLVINLLDNAAKFSSPQKSITLKLKSSDRRIYLIIRDRGKGIAAQELPKIFKKFYQGSGHSDGLGLGLFLAKNIIVQHQGKITIKSKEKKGTAVTVSLPLFSS